MASNYVIVLISFYKHRHRKGRTICTIHEQFAGARSLYSFSEARSHGKTDTVLAG